MTIRTTQTVVTFSNSFLLPNFDAPQPAGDYRVDYDEEMIEGISRTAWRRVGASICLPAIGTGRATTQMVSFEPADLDAALKNDLAQ
jgi:hypothetical protein